MPISVERHHEIYEEIREGKIKIVRRGPTASPPVYRFWARVDKEGPIHPVLKTRCWMWKAKDKGDYGHIKVRGLLTAAHRYSWFIHRGPIPDELHVLHHCDNPSCTNPDHLFVGTQADNVADMDSKDRRVRVGVTGDRNGAYTHPESRPRGDRHGSVTHPESLPRGDEHWTHTQPETVLRGEGHGNAKLNEEQVREIRRRYRKGRRGRGYAALGREFGVDQSTVASIVNWKSWTHVI